MSLLEPLGLKSHPIIFTKWYFILYALGDLLPTWNYFDEVYNQTQLLHEIYPNCEPTHKQFKMQIRAMNVSEKSFSR